ncbi:MAG: SUMF1/EgtB/PvdO family nonheme iron enzyme [Terracidiphilus sp.]
MQTGILFRAGAKPLCRALFSCCRFLLILWLALPAGRGLAQDTAYPAEDAQIPGPAKPTDRQAWLDDLRRWRQERLERIGYDGANYGRPELAWTQHNLVCAQMMIEERDFFDRDRQQYTVDRYLDRLEREFGGADSVLIWDIFPNLGVDDRNQFDRLRDMPGGIEGVRRMVADFHRRGVRVFFPQAPWDRGTRDEGRRDWLTQAELMKQIGADGLMGDTMDGMPHVYLTASEAVGHPLALHPEGLPPEEALAWNQMTWAYWSFPFVPMISRYKWLETRHMPMLVNGGRHQIDGIQAAFFNGVGYSDQQDVVGIHNGFTPRAAEALRRVIGIERAFAPLLASPEWQPHAPTVQEGVFASRFPSADRVLWTLVNRNDFRVTGAQIQVEAAAGARFFDLWHGVELTPEPARDGRSMLSFELESKGFGAVLEVHSASLPADLEKLMGEMRERSATPLGQLSDEWEPLPQRMVAIAPAHATAAARQGMILISAASFEFKVQGVEVNAGSKAGVDVQYPWEDAPRRQHDRTLQFRAFHIDRYPVTNAEFKRFLDATHYHPADEHNFLRDWRNGSYPAGWERRPVTWVSLEDARAYASWAGKRLPNEWEWQYAAQGADGRLYPWGSEWDAAAVPAPEKGRRLTAPADVDAHPLGASPFGVMDMVGNVWQWTSEFADAHTRSAILRGGSYYQPQGSMWYFPQAYRLDQHGRYLLMAPGMDRSGTIGFRCAADAD